MSLPNQDRTTLKVREIFESAGFTEVNTFASFTAEQDKINTVLLTNSTLRINREVHVFLSLKPALLALRQSEK